MSKLKVLQDCGGCGACCRTVSAPPYRIDHEYNELAIRNVPQELVDEILPAWEIRLRVSDSPCPWFDESTLRCSHYEIRPTACRDFELNSPSCYAVRLEYQIDPGCHSET
ncbi:YkgJ family cysteine cluster protein [Planctomicrobium sp. SH668]|uniref:YkgJ family cysteine cluster protein n=1 Tax=Planctomicrobium sp. SH668 TaxID=3448126 RepID=UPI003F5BDC59